MFTNGPFASLRAAQALVKERVQDAAEQDSTKERAQPSAEVRQQEHQAAYALDCKASTQTR